MFSKISRYRKLSDTVNRDSNGRRIESKSLRLLPKVSGTFLHTIEEGDRLDHLAHKFYKQSKKWWRICDANPEFMSPLGMLGKDPIVVTRFPIGIPHDGPAPPWSELRRQLSKIVGVHHIEVVDNMTLIEQEQTFLGELVTVNVPQYERALIVTYNQMNVNRESLNTLIMSALTDAGFVLEVALSQGEPENIGRIGKRIIVPSNVVG